MGAGNIQALQARLAQIDAEIGSWTFGTAPAMPNAQGAGNADFAAYRKSLWDERKQLLEALVIAEGPWEIETRTP